MIGERDHDTAIRRNTTHRYKETTYTCDNWMNLKTITLFESSQRVFTVWFHLYETAEQEKLIHGDRKQIDACLGVGVGYEGTFWDDRNVLYFGVMVAQVKTHVTLHLKCILYCM